MVNVFPRIRHCRRSDIIRTLEFVCRVQVAIARVLLIDVTTIRRVVHEDISYKLYLMSRGEFLYKKAMQNHLKRANSIPDNLKHKKNPSNTVDFLIREKLFPGLAGKAQK